MNRESNPISSERQRRITIEAGKCGGRPRIRGQRIRVTDVLELMAAGASFEEILADYPSLEREDLLAAALVSTGVKPSGYWLLASGSFLRLQSVRGGRSSEFCPSRPWEARRPPLHSSGI